VGRARAALTEMLASGNIPQRSVDDASAHRAILEELDAVSGGYMGTPDEGDEDY
jgi:RNA polymerase sigma-70 factor (ECF subfamily)